VADVTGGGRRLGLSTAAGHLLLDPASGRTGALVQAFTDLTRPGWCDLSGRLQPLFGWCIPAGR
jgi:hypothetical protein